jgi:hypothetical protein
MANFILEVVNNVRTINQQATWFFLLYFLVYGIWYPGPNGIAPADVRRFVFGLALGMWLHDTGGLIIGYTIWIFRAMGIGGGPGHPALASVYGMAAGQLTIGLAHILIVGVLSFRRFGNRLWLALVVIDIIYLMWVLI